MLKFPHFYLDYFFLVLYSIFSFKELADFISFSFIKYASLLTDLRVEAQDRDFTSPCALVYKKIKSIDMINMCRNHISYRKIWLFKYPYVCWSSITTDYYSNTSLRDQKSLKIQPDNELQNLPERSFDSLFSRWHCANKIQSFYPNRFPWYAIVLFI